MTDFLESDVRLMLTGAICGVVLLWLPSRMRRDATLPFATASAFGLSVSAQNQVAYRLLVQASRECFHHGSSMLPSVLFGAGFATSVVVPRALERANLLPDPTWVGYILSAFCAVAAAKCAERLTAALLRRTRVLRSAVPS